MVALSSQAGHGHGDAAQYVNDYERQHNDMAGLRTEGDTRLSTRRAEQEWSNKFVNTAKEATVEMSDKMGLRASSFAEGAAADLDHMESSVKNTGAVLLQVRSSSAALSS